MTTSLALLSLFSIPGMGAIFAQIVSPGLRITPRSNDLSRPRMKLYQGLVDGVASNQLCGLLSLSALMSCAVSGLGASSGLHPNNMNFGAGLPIMPDGLRCDRRLEEAVEYAFLHIWVHVAELTALVDTEHLVSIDLAYVYDNVSPRVPG